MPVVVTTRRAEVFLSEELAAAVGIGRARLARLVRLGLVEPDAPGSSVFTAVTVGRLRWMLRRHGDFGVDPTGAAIIVDLLEQLERLETELAHWRGGAPEVVVFRALTEAGLARIVAIHLDGLRRRLAERQIALEVTEAAKAHLARVGYDPVFGARPLKRAIQREVETPVARLIVAGKVRDGTVRVDVVGDALQIEAARGLSRTTSPPSSWRCSAPARRRAR